MFVHSVITSDGAALLRQSKSLNKKIIFVKAISSSNFEKDRDRLVSKSLPSDRVWFDGIDGSISALNNGNIRISFEASATTQTVKSVGVVARLEDSETDVLFSLSSDDNSQVTTAKTISFVQSLPISSISDNFGAVCQYGSEYVCQFYLKAGQICQQENGSGVWGSYQTRANLALRVSALTLNFNGDGNISSVTCDAGYVADFKIILADGSVTQGSIVANGETGTHTFDSPVALTDKETVILTADFTPVSFVDIPIIRDDKTKPLMFLSLQNNSSIKLMKTGTINDQYEKSTDLETWTDLAFNSKVDLNADERVYIRIKAHRGAVQNGSRYIYFVMTGAIEAYHNTQSLISPNFNTTDLTSLTNSNWSFYYLFKDCTSLKRAPMLPATTLEAKNVYAYMFYRCTGLVEAPILPATTLTDSCYSNMFYGCTSLVEAPDLLATTLAQGCYNSMFQYCSGLTKASSLPATTLAQGCYNSMFSGCTSLTKAPDLLATTLAQTACYKMFNSCTSLAEVKILATDISAFMALDSWLSGVAATGDFYCVEGVNYPENSASGIPEGWTRHNVT